MVLLAIAVFSPPVFGAGDQRSSRVPGLEAQANRSAPEPEHAAGDCCSGAMNFGTFIDFNTLSREEIQSEFRPNGVLFGRGASGEAPATLVEFDYSRPIGCRKVLSGAPFATGWEFFIFVDPNENHWAPVQRVGASIGHSKNLQSCFIAAYDAQGNLLEAKYNEEFGFQFVAIERPTADIHMVLVGDCQSSGAICYPDPAGSALNCLTFSSPISTTVDLPSLISIPQPPIRVGMPSTSPRGLVVLVMALALAGIWGLRTARSTPGRS